MKSKSKKDGKIFTGKFASLAVKIGLADPIEEEGAVKAPVKAKKPAKKPVKKTGAKKATKVKK